MVLQLMDKYAAGCHFWNLHEIFMDCSFALIADEANAQ
jgi:hypothetical protein